MPPGKRYPRYALDLPVLYNGDDGSGEGRMIDLSLSGVRVRAAVAVPGLGSSLSIWFQPHPAMAGFTLVGQVAAVHPDGFAVHFAGLTDDQREDLAVALPPGATVPVDYGEATR